MFTYRRRSIVFVVAIAFVVAGGLAPLFAGGQTEGEATTDTEADGQDWPDKLVFAAVPTEDQEIISRRYSDLMSYLEERLDIETEMYFPTSYMGTIEAMRTGNVDVAKLGPFSYILAVERANPEMFAVPTDVGEAPVYYSAFITLEGSGINELSDLEGKRVAFADPASTSGHLFPRAAIVNELGIANDSIEDFFGETSFSGSHQASASAVLNGDVDAAPISSGSGFRSLEGPLSDHPNADKVVVFYRTGDIPSDGYVMRRELPEDFRAAVRGAFYDAVNDPELEAFFEELGTAGFIRRTDADYDIIRETASAIEMSPEELMD